MKIKLVFNCVGSAVGPKPNSVALQFLQRREDVRLTRLMLTIFCCFLLCFLPLMLVNVADDEVSITDVCTSFSAVDTLFRLWQNAILEPKRIQCSALCYIFPVCISNDGASTKKE